MRDLLMFIVCAGGFYVLYKIKTKIDMISYKKEVVKVYGDYYAEKCRQFTWLDKWIKDHANTPEKRAEQAIDDKLSSASLACLAILFGGGLIFWFILNAIFHPIRFVPTTIVQIIALAAAFVPSILVGRKMTRKPINPGVLDPEGLFYKKGLTLECPQCHCPHAWGMVREKNTVTGGSTMTQTTTRSGYGQGDFMDSLGEGFQSNGTTKKSWSTWTYDAERDFVCLNCNHKEHNVYHERGYSLPDEDPHEFHPPELAWGSLKIPEEKKQQAKEEAIARGDPQALYDKGHNAAVNDDYKTAFTYYQKAVEKGHVYAHLCLGLLYYYKTRGVPHDKAKGRELIAKAAELGVKEAEERLKNLK
jgi:hypothetical protein